MTEKRFTTSGYYVYDHQTDAQWLVNKVEIDDIVNKMNNLDIKAKERSKALSTLQKKYDALHKENQSLKQSIENLLNDEKYWEKKAKQRVQELEEENQALKQTIKEAYNNERTQIGKSVLKQLLEQLE